MKYILKANARTIDTTVSENHITRNFTSSTTIIRQAPIDAASGRLIPFLTEDELRGLEKMIDADKPAGWMSFNKTEGNVWLGKDSKFVFIVRGNSRILDMNDGYDKVAYAIAKHAGLVGEPGTDGKHIFDVHKGNITSQKTGIIAFDNLDTILKQFDKLEFKGEKLGYALFVSGVKTEVLSENFNDSQLKDLIKSSMMLGNNLNVAKIEKTMSELKAKTPEELTAEIYWATLEFLGELESSASSIGLRYKYKDLTWKNKDAGIKFIAKGLVENLETAKTIAAVIKNYK